MRQYLRGRCLHALSICLTVYELLPKYLFLRAVHRNFDRPSKKSQRIYQIQKTKKHAGGLSTPKFQAVNGYHPFYQFCVRFQVDLGTREKIEKKLRIGSRSFMPTLGHFHELLKMDSRRAPCYNDTS